MPAWITILQPRPLEEPVSLPLLGTPAPMSLGGGPAGASPEPGGDPGRTFSG